MSSVDWILVADRSRAVVLHVLPNQMKPFPTLLTLVHPQSRLRGRQVDSDASGSSSFPQWTCRHDSKRSSHPWIKWRMSPDE